MTSVEERADGVVLLRGDALDVEVDPDNGCDIRQVRHVASRSEVLWQTPWTPQRGVPALPLDASVAGWLRAYPGGWQLLLPNAGDPGEVDGVPLGFHGEASVSRWERLDHDSGLRARLRCYDAPLTIERTIDVDGATVTVSDSVRNDGCAPVRFVWGHHPGFGADLLGSGVDGVRLEIERCLVTVDDVYDPPGNLLAPGVRAEWPHVPGRDGHQVDLSRPREGSSLFAYLTELAKPEVGIVNDDVGLRATLRWDPELFPAVWLWEEIGGTRSAPWFGRGRVIGIEPCTTFPGHGLADAVARGRHVHELLAGDVRTGTVQLTVEH